jgi:hexosaminidase
MDPTRESTYRFLDALIGEIAQLFPDKYWHIGGDEVDPTQWHANPKIQAYMRAHHIANEVALHTAFNARLFAIVRRHGKTPVGWDEIFQPNLPTSAVIQSWRGTAVLAAAAKAGFRGILSAPYYIDHMKAAADFYLADPLPAGTDLTPEQQALVLGGEACMWSEYIVPGTLESRVWPRLAAIAERFWSPANVVDIADMYRRLDVTSQRLADLGLDHEQYVAQRAHALAGDSAALFQTLLRYVHPKDFGGSGVNQFFPHTRLIDAAVPDPRASWDMAGRARRALAGDSAAIRTLRSDFVAMAGLAPRLVAARASIPAASDALPVAGALASLGRLGTDALDLLARHAAPNASWQAGADSLFAALAPRPTSAWLLVPTATSAVRVLVDAARGLPPSRTTP